MEKIYLCLKEYTLGYLTKGDNCYIFFADSDGTSKAKNDYPVIMKFFKLNTRGMKEYKDIPYHYSDYLQCLQREDLINKANISPSDDDFAKIKKLAKLKLNAINFTIK